MPSLAQLLDAVEAAKQDLSPETVTVIVDATFGHRIEEPEQEQFEDKISSGEIIIPPAGIIGRGDAFILEVAEKADAVVLSNDSFQEFHGDYRWLFDEGRLLGGKHVPGVGWIFLARSPVRGPASRKAISEARTRNRTGTAAKKQPAAKKKTSGRRRGGAKDEKVPAKAAKAAANAAKKVAKKVRHPTKSGGSEPEPYNEPLPFIEFVGAHAVGSTVEGEVEQFSSHGAYVMVGDTRCYVPLRSMGDPPPRSARDILDQGETRSFVVDAIDTPRRGIDLTLVAPESESKTRAKAKAKPPKPQPKEDKQRPAEPETKPEQPEEHLVTDAEVDDENLSVSQRRRLRAQLEAQEASASATPDTDAVEEGTSPKPKTAEPAEKTAAKRSPARKRAAKKAPAAKKTTASTKKAAAKKSTRASSTKKSGMKAASTKKASTKKTGSKRSAPAKKTPAKKAPAKKAPAKKAPAKKSSTKSTRSTSRKKSAPKRSDG